MFFNNIFHIKVLIFYMQFNCIFSPFFIQLVSDISEFIFSALKIVCVMVSDDII